VRGHIPYKIALFARNQTFWRPQTLGWLRYWFLAPLSRGANARFDLRADAANKFRGAISAIFVSQVSPPVA